MGDAQNARKTVEYTGGFWPGLMICLIIFSGFFYIYDVIRSLDIKPRKRLQSYIIIISLCLFIIFKIIFNEFSEIIIDDEKNTKKLVTKGIYIPYVPWLSITGGRPHVLSQRNISRNLATQDDLPDYPIQSNTVRDYIHLVVSVLLGGILGYYLTRNKKTQNSTYNGVNMQRI